MSVLGDRLSATAHRVRSMSTPARQAMVGLLALPLSVLPFVAYAQLTPEGGLLATKVHAAIAPLDLPQFEPEVVAEMRARAPQWSGLVAVLVYHGLGEGSAEERLTISPDRFAEQVATLRASGMNPVTAADLAAARSGRSGLPDNAVLITFDDGRTDAFLWADDVLAKAQWRATMFVITTEAAHPSLYYESWEELEVHADSGRWDIQSHSAGMHFMQQVAEGPPLPALTSLSPLEDLDSYRSRIEADLTSSVEAITQEVGHPPQAFAYPFGAYGAERHNDPAIRAALAEILSQEFTLGFQQDDQATIPLAGCGGDPLLVRRLEVGDWPGSELIDRLATMAALPESAAAIPCPTAH